MRTNSDANYRNVVQEGSGTLALRGDQSRTFLMHDLEDCASPQQVLVASGPADVGTTLPCGLVAHLITDRVAEILRNCQLMWRVPGGRRRDLDRAVAFVADPGACDGDLAEGGLEGVGPCPSALDAVAALAVTALEDQFVVGLLDEGPEEPTLGHLNGKTHSV